MIENYDINSRRANCGDQSYPPREKKAEKKGHGVLKKVEEVTKIVLNKIAERRKSSK